MSRPLRLQFPGAWYHVMNRGAHRQWVFQDEGDRHEFFRVLESAARLWQVRIHAYSLMPNHYHLLLETPEANLSRAMRHINGVYTQRFNRRHERDGPLFRGRFKSILVEKDRYLLELVRYIHLNGVRALLYRSAREDPYASHRVYLGLQARPAWLTTEVALAQLNPHLETARKLLDDFVQKGVSEQLEQVLQHKQWPAILGTKHFRRQVRTLFKKDTDSSREQPQAKEIRRIYTPQEVLHRVAKRYGVPLETLLRRNSFKNNEARKTAMYLLRIACLLPYREIGKLLGGVTYGAVAPVCQQMERQADKRLQLHAEILGGDEI